MPVSPAFRPSMAHMDLGAEFYDPVAPAVFPKHILRHRDQEAAASVGLEMLTDEEWIAHFGRFEPLPGTFPQPLALRYHGHQFRHYNPDLGDGRGFLFAQMHDVTDGRLLDLGTKGSGRTPWSRGGDGRLTLQGGIREILAAEMLRALQVNTSTAFSLIETGENLQRHDEASPTRSSVLVRLSHSHIRIGSFQRLAAFQKKDEIEKLVHYVLETYYSDLPEDDLRLPALRLFDAVCDRVAKTGAQWMAAGFVHGVLNTDNINITGESFDYGPWRFLPHYDPHFTAAYFDHEGLYAYERQPEALQWNLARFGECLLDLVAFEDLREVLAGFSANFALALDAAWLRRLGLAAREPEKNRALRIAVTGFLKESGISFSAFPFDWFGGTGRAQQACSGPRAAYYDSESFLPVRAALENFCPLPGVEMGHSFFGRDMPCAMLREDVERVWTPIAEQDDWNAFQNLRAEIALMRQAFAIKD